MTAQDLDLPPLSVGQFSRAFRFKMVKAYPVISDVPDAYEATLCEIDCGFARILQSRNLRPVVDSWLADNRRASERKRDLAARTAANRAVMAWIDADPGRDLVGCTPSMVAGVAINAFLDAGGAK